MFHYLEGVYKIDEWCHSEEGVHCDILSYGYTLLLITILLWKYREWFIPICDQVAQNPEAFDSVFCCSHV